MTGESNHVPTAILSNYGFIFQRELFPALKWSCPVSVDS